MEIIKKKHIELIALYKLENSIKDIYVEGNSDKVFLDNYLKTKKCCRKTLQIETVDFSELQPDYCEGLDMNSNRNKVIILSKLLNESLPSTKVRCLVDMDFDYYIESISNSKLLKTDFCCLESYLFCDDVIEKFLNIGIGNFPFDAHFILEQLASVLKPLFCLRLLRQLNFPSAKLVEIDKNLQINKNNGTINFDKYEYLKKFINKNNLMKQSKNIHKDYDNLFNRLNIEIRHNLNGHDFIDIFFLYINKIKNTQNFKKNVFCKSLFLTAETSMLEEYPLFKEILQ